MKQEHRELIRIFEGFRKLNVASILPNLTHAEFGILKTISCCHKTDPCEEGIKISDIIGHLKVPGPAASRTMKSLEEQGLIIRTVNKQDRRNVYVRLTEAGTARLAEADQILDEFQDAVFGSMGVENMNRLIQYLQELQEVMAQEINARKYKKDKQRKG